MVDAADIVGLLVIVFINSAVAALMTRFFRVRLNTDWGSAVYILLFGPFVLTVLTLIFGGPLSLGPDLGSPALVLGITVALPLALGISFDFFWMPAPEEVDLPDRQKA